jgi:hypothetical protein
VRAEARAAAAAVGLSQRGGPTDTTTLEQFESPRQEQIMARRRSPKETYAQKVVGLATVGLPAPVQSVAKSRWGSRLLLLAIPALIATGVITVSWSGGLPNITVNKDRAAVVGQEVRQEAIKAAERVRQYGENNSNFR